VAAGRACVLGGVFTSFTLFTAFGASVPQLPTFRTRTDLVELDVSVLDKERRPVRGLMKADFTVLEDGKPQDISIFEAIDVPDPEVPPIAWMRDVTPDVTTNETRITRLWVLAIDDALIPTDPSAIKAAKQIVRDIIDRFGPDDLVAVVFTADSRQAQDFTSDRTKLLATLNRFSPGLAYWKNPTLGLPFGSAPLVDLAPDLRKQDEQFWLGSVNTLRNIVNTLIAIPHSRKALIWVTPGVPLDMQAVATGKDVPSRVAALTKEVADTARRANVPIYPIDPSGLGGLESYITGKVGTYLPQGVTPPWTMSQDYAVQTAVNTGGRPIVNTNDFGPGIAEIFRENSSYYLIGYNPTNIKTDGTLRRLEVKVNRKDVDVRTKSGYLAPKPGDLSPKSTNATLATAAASSVPMRELPLRATVAPFALPGGRNAAIAIALGVRQVVPDNAAHERATVTTELRTNAFTTEGTVKGAQRHTATVVLRPGATGDADYEVLSRIDLPPGRYRLRLAAFHAAAAKTGTVMVDVVVPDFGRDPASMSGVVIGATPGRPSAPRDLLVDVLPIIPTAQRAFAKTERATALFYLYQSGSKPLVSARVATQIVDSRGATVVTETSTFPVDRFRGAEATPTARPVRPPNAQAQKENVFANQALRAAEIQYRLPLDRLAPGSYLLTFEATIGVAVLRRDVQFEIK
jgi:VWFA-related protein